MKKNFKIIFIFLLSILLNTEKIQANEKIKIGLLIPLTGKNKEIGQSIIKSTKLAINKINNPLIEIIPKDTKSNPEVTLRSAKELQDIGVKIIIGPIYQKNLEYLDELKDIKFLSLTNKITNNPSNVISVGINANSQLLAIKKFIENNKIKKTIFLTPNVDYKSEIKKGILSSKIKIVKNYIYYT